MKKELPLPRSLVAGKGIAKGFRKGGASPFLPRMMP